jgi:DNA topoisomerase-3
VSCAFRAPLPSKVDQESSGDLYPLATVSNFRAALTLFRIGSERSRQRRKNANRLISGYPRTETEKFRPEFEHQPLIQQLANFSHGNEVGAHCFQVPDGEQFRRERAADDQAHPPIV